MKKILKFVELKKSQSGAYASDVFAIVKTSDSASELEAKKLYFVKYEDLEIADYIYDQINSFLKYFGNRNYWVIFETSEDIFQKNELQVLRAIFVDINSSKKLKLVDEKTNDPIGEKHLFNYLFEVDVNELKEKYYYLSSKNFFDIE